MDHQTENQVTNQEYLNGIVHELMADTSWELPPECRFFLVAGLEWGLLAL